MSKMNAFRVINLNYNNNAIRIEDETFYLDGESTLLSLQNGGGKSVLVQMLLAPFVRRRYRDTVDRPFSSYFTTNKPTHLIVEWKLDGGAGYVMTGMMIRQNQNNSDQEDSTEELEIINYIHEYQYPNSYDIDQLPVVELEGKIRKLKGFNACRSLFEERKKEREYSFLYYDMTQSHQQKQYFMKLKEFGINHEEWETIIKKINLKESGLSDLFKDAKDEAGLIEKWFLPAVESKLNQDGNRMKQFQSILMKYISQYKEHQAKIERKVSIIKFKEDAALIREKNNKYLEISNKKLLQQQKLAYLRSCIAGFVKSSEIRAAQLGFELEDLIRQKNVIRYEQSSYDIYQCMDDLNAKQELHQQYVRRMEEQQKELNDILYKLYIQECARLYRDYKQETKEVLEIENRLEIVKQGEKELIPERENIGYNLRLYYEKYWKEQQLRVKNITETITNLEDEVNEFREQKVSEEEQNRKLNNQIGQLTEKVRYFDDKEAKFKEQYSLHIVRNILGLYEEGTLEVLETETLKKIDTLITEHQKLGQHRVRLTQQVESYERAIQDKSKNLGLLLASNSEKENQLNELKKQCEERLSLMRYLDLPQELYWNTEQLITTCSGKIEDLEKVNKEYQYKLELLKDEYKTLQSGEVLKLPEEFKELLEEIGLHYVMGMDWLKKNGYKQEINQELLKKNPMIPYSIIISEQELNRLLQQKINFYTSYPIPIICKEKLSQEVHCINHGVFHVENIVLFVAFNDHLLDPIALEELLKKKQGEIDHLAEKCNLKQKDIDFYVTIKNQISYQKLTKEYYEELEDLIHTIANQITQLEEEITSSRIQKSNWAKEIEQLNSNLFKISAEESKERNLLKAIKEFHEEYAQYQEQKLHLIGLSKRVIKSTDNISQLDKKLTELTNKIGDFRIQYNEESNKSAELQGKCTQFKNYQEGSILYKDLEDLEARYQAITQDISKDVAQLEANLIKANERLMKAQDHLVKRTDKYNLSEEEYNKALIDDYLVGILEQNQGKLENEISRQEKSYHELEKSIAVKESEILRYRRDLLEKFGVEEPCNRSQIIDIEFKKRLKLMDLALKEKEEISKIVTKQMTDYQACLALMAEFSNINTELSFDYHEELVSYGGMELSQLDYTMLQNFQGVQIREYRNLTANVHESKQALSKILDQILRKTEYGDDFFHKPLERMLELLDLPEVIIEQLEIILQSYQALLEKLQVDIDLVEQEKQKVLEMLFDYIEEIHKNMGKIDKNSTITVKNRSLKMLKLNLPSWEEQQSVYELRLNDYLEELTRRGLERLNQNGNIEELIGATATTRNLYDSVVGIGNISIRLYKIEAQREYPITWSQVSKNSGGEGFLSAFAVLSCLLSYMRRDDTDLFTEREEGKVIVMDNPFAQTNASHLLIPLMDIAKKSNTQLICLSGLGGESIYNRFDNIFVLNLVESGLQKEVQYLTSEHVKGDVKIYQLSTARVQVETMEQMELLF